MRKTALFAGVLASATIFLVGAAPASAMSQDYTANNKSISLITLASINTGEEKTPEDNNNNQEPQDNQAQQSSEQEAQPVPQPVQHTVVKGDSLSKIAKVHSTTWKRLFNKNTQLQHPDIINPNDTITIPSPDEVLADRPVPTAVQAEQPATSAPAAKPARKPVAQPKRSAAAAKPSARISRGSSSGNMYVRGYCTWYAKNRRPDLPNNLGNANTWVARARAQGIPTGSIPRIGAIGQQGMHVVYVEQVHANGTVTVSEMNFKGFGITSSRTVPASTFQYIY